MVAPSSAVFLNPTVLIILLRTVLSAIPDSERYEYKASTVRASSWSNAKSRCESESKQILTLLESTEELNQVQNAVHVNQPDAYWIGSSESVALLYGGAWQTGEPNSALETCIAIDINKKLLDLPCSANWLKFMCRKDLRVDGYWGSWLSWSSCTKTCGGGTRNRFRYCDNPSPAHTGSACGGDSIQSVVCATGPCPVNGNWGGWFAWGSCSVTCGWGSKSRQRYCNNPTPAYGGNQCNGDEMGSMSCDMTPCPIHGGYRDWSLWTNCEGLCETGNKNRSRICDDPLPQYGGDDCSDLSEDVTNCPLKPCPGCDVSKSDQTIVSNINEAVCKKMGYCYDNWIRPNTCFMKQAPPGNRFEILSERKVIAGKSIIDYSNSESRITCLLKCQRREKCVNVLFSITNEKQQLGTCYFLKEEIESIIEMNDLDIEVHNCIKP